MSLVSLLKSMLVDAAKKRLEKEVVNVVKDILLPYLVIEQAKTFRIRTIGVPELNTNYIETDVIKINKGNYLAGTKSTNPVYSEVDESTISTSKLDTNLVPKVPVYGIEDTNYVIHNNVMVKYSTDVVVEQLDNFQLRLEDVDTYFELRQYLNQLNKR